MRAVLFHNPKAGSSDCSKKELLAALRLADIEADYCSTKGKHFEKGLKRALASDADLLVVAGGDGTVAKVLAALAGQEIPAAILPLGTANNIARSLGVGGAALELVESWRPGLWEPLDIGIATGPWGRKRFVEAVGLGALPVTMLDEDANGAEGAERLRKGREAFKRLLEDAWPIEAEIKLDGEAVAGDLLAVEIVNIPFTGPGLPLAPEADPGDGRLDVLCVRRGDREDMLEWVVSPKDGPPPAPLRRAREVSLRWTGTPLRIDDAFLDAPEHVETVTVALESKPVRVLVPERRGAAGGICAA